jgi:hypothetical protein
MSQEAQSGKNWSRVAALYAKSVNENDLKSASGAACTEILKAVDETLPFSKASFIVDMGCGNGRSSADCSTGSMLRKSRTMHVRWLRM